MTQAPQTATDILRAVLHQHQGDSNRRGHMPGCRYGWWLRGGGVPEPCTPLCQAAQRVIEHGDVVQGRLM